MDESLGKNQNDIKELLLTLKTPEIGLFEACKGYHEYTDELESSELESRSPEFRRLIFKSKD